MEKEVRNVGNEKKSWKFWKLNKYVGNVGSEKTIWKWKEKL